MPAKRSSRTPAKGKPAAAATPTTAETRRSRSRRGASPPPAPATKAGSKRKASPSPAPAKSTPAKRGRKESASPAPAKKQPARSKSTKKEEPPAKPSPAKGRAASRGKAADNQKQSRVTRAVVEEVDTKKSAASSRGRSASKQKPAPSPQKKETPKRSATPKKSAAASKATKTPPAKAKPRGKSATPKAKPKAPTPKKKVTPKQTPKSKQATLKKTPASKKKQQTTPKQKATKAKTPTKPAAATKKSPARRSKAKTPEKPEAEEIKKDEPESKDEAQPATSDDEIVDKAEPESMAIEKSVESENEEAEADSKAEPTEEETEPESKEETEQAKSDDEAAKEETEQAKSDNEAAKEETEQAKSDDEATAETEDTKEESKEDEEEEEDEEEKVESETPEADVDKAAESEDAEAAAAGASVEEIEPEEAEEEEESEPVEPEPVEEEEAMEEEAVPEKEEAEVEESAEAVKDETSAQEDENVEEDQDVSKDNVVSNDNVEIAAGEDQVDQNDMPEKMEEDVAEPQSEMLEHQAESEQIESGEKEECESAESDQVEADVTAPEVVELQDSPKETPKTVETIELNSDESSKDGAEVVSINEDSGDGIIEISEDSKEAQATGGGDAPYDDSAKVEDDDIQEITVSPEGDNAVQQQNDVSCTGVEVAEDAVQVLDAGNMVNSTVPNGATGGSSSPRKRKFDETEDAITDDFSPKKARISADEEQIENGSVSQDNEVSEDYVVVEMGEVPSADSKEVKDCLPQEVVQQSGSGADENPVYNRAFIPNPGFTSTGDGAKQFSIVSYNILADCHLFRNDYSFTDGQFLVPEYRLTGLMKELEYLNGDVVCLQEVDPNFFSDTLLPKMRSLGYEGIHKKRTTEYFKEGEATFYKLSRFSLVDCTTSKLADLVEKELVSGIEPTIQDAVRKYMDLPDVVVVTKLRCNNTGSEVTVGNIHVNWGEMKTPDAQCVQIASAIKEVVSKAGVDNLPHLICGDFNSPPLSPGYLVARDGYPGDETVTKLQEIKGLQLSSGQPASLVNSLWPAFQHTSRLMSAYNEVEGSEPEITSFNRVMCDTVDYVFYSCSSLSNVGVLRTAPQSKVKETGGIPNKDFPSDHVSLKVVLAFK